LVGENKAVSGARKLLLAAACVILIVAIGWIPVQNWRAGPAKQSGCELLRAIADHTVKSADHGMIPALIIGDSWSAGLGQPDTNVTVATWLAADLGWNARINAFSGSGFVNASACGDQNYALRTPRIQVTDRNVLFQGGLNDVNSVGQERKLIHAAAEVVAKAIARAPTAAIILVGPPYVPARSAALVKAADRDLAAVCRFAGVTYVSTLGWKGDLQPDGLHPSAAGSRSYAAYVAAKLRQPVG
jgi:acyl-CoA thioesterase I